MVKATQQTPYTGVERTAELAFQLVKQYLIVCNIMTFSPGSLPIRFSTTDPKRRIAMGPRSYLVGSFVISSPLISLWLMVLFDGGFAVVGPALPLSGVMHSLIQHVNMDIFDRPNGNVVPSILQCVFASLPGLIIAPIAASLTSRLLSISNATKKVDVDAIMHYTLGYGMAMLSFATFVIIILVLDISVNIYLALHGLFQSIFALVVGRVLLFGVPMFMYCRALVDCIITISQRRGVRIRLGACSIAIVYINAAGLLITVPFTKPMASLFGTAAIVPEPTIAQNYGAKPSKGLQVGIVDATNDKYDVVIALSVESPDSTERYLTSGNWSVTIQWRRIIGKELDKEYSGVWTVPAEMENGSDDVSGIITVQPGERKLLKLTITHLEKTFWGDRRWEDGGWAGVITTVNWFEKRRSDPAGFDNRVFWESVQDSSAVLDYVFWWSAEK